MSFGPRPDQGENPIFLEIHPAESGFHRYLIRCGAFPVPALVLQRWLGLYRTLRPLLFPAPAVPLPVIQMWHLHHGDGASVLSRNAQAWMPDFGAGVWLDGPPPRLWTPEDFMQLGPGDMLPPPVLTAIRLRGPVQTQEQMWMQLGGRGCYMEFTVSGDAETFFERQAQAFREWIDEPMIAAHPFFVPLLKGSTFTSALFSTRQRHTDPILTYVRESAEDQGLLILSREKLDEKLLTHLKTVPWASPDPSISRFLVRLAAG